MYGCIQVKEVNFLDYSILKKNDITTSILFIANSL